MKLPELLFRIRGYTPIPFLAVAFILSDPQKGLIILGLLLIIFGEILRILGVSYAGSHTRTREVGAPVLVTNGPYAFLRNPLYLGDIFIYTGAIITMGGGLPYLMWIVILFFSVQYVFIIRLEESKLMELFGQKYKDYINAVPRYFPRLSPYPNRTYIKPDVISALKSERSTFFNMFLVAIIFIMRWHFLTT